MIKKCFGLLNKVIYRFKFGKRISFDGIPSFIYHMQINVKSGNIKIGKNFSIKQGVYLAAVEGGEINIGNNVSLNRNCIIVSQDSIYIGDNCAIGPNTFFYDHDHNFGTNGIESGYKKSPIFIGKNCWIGAGCIILRGTKIGEGSIIGAGTVVKGNIPSHSLVTQENRKNLSISPL